ncbi:MAG: 2-oxo acid dehydrogenase subunit E2 [Gemmataceae bacterium]|nr:2-oxo acid dehydrogenase subunit E2 [Gemmataceae bacterium]MCI0739789.1 2-oxo acid dehydrogenase subunit E2 [Gemmataceae bacterium]
MPGRSLPLHVSRRLVNDMIALGRSIPLYLVEKAVDLERVAHERRRASVRISWTALFLKGFALLAEEYPPLRQAYCSWPWPRLYEHDHSTATIAVNRQVEGADRLFWARIRKPAAKPLVELQVALDRFRTAPVEEVFRSQLRFARVPGLFRRLLWRLAYSFSGRVRAKKFGTFGLSTVASQGIYNRFYPSILSANLALGPLDERGGGMVGLLFDHRVVDGVAIVEALKRLEAIMQTEIASELAQLAGVSSVRARAS